MTERREAARAKPHYFLARGSTTVDAGSEAECLRKPGGRHLETRIPEAAALAILARALPRIGLSCSCSEFRPSISDEIVPVVQEVCGREAAGTTG